MNLTDLLENLAERAISIRVSADGKPKLIGKDIQITSPMKEALTAYRTEIIERFKPRPCREFLWQTWHRYTDPDDMPADWLPVGAWWQRLEGETEWNRIPGRPVDCSPPEGA